MVLLYLSDQDHSFNVHYNNNKQGKYTLSP